MIDTSVVKELNKSKSMSTHTFAHKADGRLIWTFIV